MTPPDTEGMTITGMPPGPERCTRCDRAMCRCRNCKRPPGMVRHEGRGLCKACFVANGPRRYRTRGSQAGLPRRISIDHAVIDQALAGTQPRMNWLERHETITYLTRCGLSARSIAQRLGINPRTVVRHRTARALEHLASVAA